MMKVCFSAFGFAVMVGGALALAACGKAQVCVPGSTLRCVGFGNCSGGQACLVDGSGYGACDCGTVGTGGGTATGGGVGGGQSNTGGASYGGGSGNGGGASSGGGMATGGGGGVGGGATGGGSGTGGQTAVGGGAANGGGTGVGGGVATGGGATGGGMASGGGTVTGGGGGTGGGATGGGSGTGGCTQLSSFVVADTRGSYSTDLIEAVAANNGVPEHSIVSVQVYRYNNGTVPGAMSFCANPLSDTCKYASFLGTPCASMPTGPNDCTRAYVSTSGTGNAISASANHFSLTLSNVTYREVTIDDQGFIGGFVDGGHCVKLNSATLDATF